MQRRKFTTASQRAAHIGRWRQSGKSKVAYCKAEGINYLTFISWFRGYGKKTSSHNAFLPVVVSEQADQPAAFATYHLPGGGSLQLHARVQASFIGQLLRSCR